METILLTARPAHGAEKITNAIFVRELARSSEPPATVPLSIGRFTSLSDGSAKRRTVAPLESDLSTDGLLTLQHVRAGAFGLGIVAIHARLSSLLHLLLSRLLRRRLNTNDIIANATACLNDPACDSVDRRVRFICIAQRNYALYPSVILSLS